jgi:signal transduction histidine kinase
MRNAIGFFKKRAGWNVVENLPKQDWPLSERASSALLEIFQQALANVAGHAKATNLFISMSLDGHDLILRIEDDGVGVDLARVQKSTSMGVVGMQENAESIGGCVTLSPRLPTGTQVLVRIPVGADCTQVPHTDFSNSPD